MSSRADIKLLSDIVWHPRKYDHVVNVPSRFDAAEMLFNEYWDEINNKVAELVESVLLNSGKYIKMK